MLRHPVLAERMTDKKLKKIVNLVSKGTDIEVRQEAALFVNAQVFQDPGICVPEGRNRRKRRGGALGAGRDRERDDGMSELSDVGEDDDTRRVKQRAWFGPCVHETAPDPLAHHGGSCP